MRERAAKLTRDVFHQLNQSIAESMHLHRHEKFSIIKVKHISGASVPSIMFVVKDDYKIAKIRGAKYFINHKEWIDKEGNWMYKIGYSYKDNNDPIYYFGKDIDTSKELKFFSVKDYDMFWGEK